MPKDKEKELIRVNRFEVIDHTDTGGGREYVKWRVGNFYVSFSMQDDGRTLKVFLTEESE